MNYPAFCRPIYPGDETMTFEEKLDRARTGSRAAYESLCLSSVDGLYTAAIIALKDEKTAKKSSKSAKSETFLWATMTM